MPTWLIFSKLSGRARLPPTAITSVVTPPLPTGERIEVLTTPSGTGGQIWASAGLLTRYLLQHREELRVADAAIVELGTGTGTGPYDDCRSTQCCVAVYSRYTESVTRLGGYRALKKTLDAPYATVVHLP